MPLSKPRSLLFLIPTPLEKKSSTVQSATPLAEKQPTKTTSNNSASTKIVSPLSLQTARPISKTKPSSKYFMIPLPPLPRSSSVPQGYPSVVAKHSKLSWPTSMSTPAKSPISSKSAVLVSPTIRQTSNLSPSSPTPSSLLAI